MRKPKASTEAEQLLHHLSRRLYGCAVAWMAGLPPSGGLLDRHVASEPRNYKQEGSFGWAGSGKWRRILNGLTDPGSGTLRETETRLPGSSQWWWPPLCEALSAQTLASNTPQHFYAKLHPEIARCFYKRNSWNRRIPLAHMSGDRKLASLGSATHLDTLAALVALMQEAKRAQHFYLFWKAEYILRAVLLRLCCHYPFWHVRQELYRCLRLFVADVPIKRIFDSPWYYDEKSMDAEILFRIRMLQCLRHFRLVGRSSSEVAGCLYACDTVDYRKLFQDLKGMLKGASPSNIFGGVNTLLKQVDSQRTFLVVGDVVEQPWPFEPLKPHLDVEPCVNETIRLCFWLQSARQDICRAEALEQDRLFGADA